MSWPLSAWQTVTVVGFDTWLAERLMQTNVGRASAERGIFEAQCPFCKDRAHSFWFSLRTRRWGCLRKVKCGQRGDAVQLVMALDGVPYAKAIRTVQQSGPRFSLASVASVRGYHEEAARGGTCQLPAEYVTLRGKLFDDRVRLGMTGFQAVAYLGGRGVSPHQMERHHLGYCVSGRYNGRIIIPVIEAGEVVYFVARLYLGRGRPYLNPTVAEAGGRSQVDVLFNLDGVQGRPRVRVVEGVFDALAEERRGEAVVAMLGLSFSLIQAAKLALTGCLEAIVEADGDAPWVEIEKIARRLEGVMRVSIARPEHDPDDQSYSPKSLSYSLSSRVKERLRRGPGRW